MNPGCEKCKYKDMNPHKEPCVNCWVFDERPNFEQRPQTNYDRLISKTPEELAEIMVDYSYCPPGTACKPICKECWIAWFKSPVEVDNG